MPACSCVPFFPFPTLEQPWDSCTAELRGLVLIVLFCLHDDWKLGTAVRIDSRSLGNIEAISIGILHPHPWSEFLSLPGTFQDHDIVILVSADRIVKSTLTASPLLERPVGHISCSLSPHIL